MKRRQFLLALSSLAATVAMRAYAKEAVKSPSWQTVAYNDSRLTFLGRFVDAGGGMFSGWCSPQIVFKVSGITSLDVLCWCSDTTTTERCLIQYVIDNSAVDTTEGSVLTTYANVFSGDLSSTIPIPNTAEHTVTLQLSVLSTGSPYAAQYIAAEKTIFKGLRFDSAGSLTVWPQGTVNLQTVGDSWTASYNGWTRLLDRAHFKLDAVATPGIVIPTITSQYKYDYSGYTNTTDPTFAGITIMFGVNEYNTGVSVAMFQTNLLALIDEIRLRQASAKIIMIRTPSNGVLNYGQYGIAMSNAVGLRDNTYYCDTSSLDTSLSGHWVNAGHPNSIGKAILAAFVDNYLKTTAGL